MRVGKKARIMKMTGRIGGVFLTRAGFEHFKADLKAAWAASSSPSPEWSQFERIVNIFLTGVENEANRKARRALRHTLCTLSRDQVVSGASRGMLGQYGLEVSKYPSGSPSDPEPEDFPKTYFVRVNPYGLLPASKNSGSMYLSRAGFEFFKEDLRAAYEAAPPPAPAPQYGYGYGYRTPTPPQGPRKFEDYEKAAHEFFKSIEESVARSKAHLEKKRDRLEKEIQKLKDFTL